ncbi:hypothetical protein BpHYR1_037235 [Brachionus plicatilis]|uniref:Uncharacterized protein n=1 Tax=Brachionus plicatilis TaxID=10195 RepID=A0A3M7PS91_BRAPC|nr:hypothetical protein BpHYR1_037235 [Brachionus plicatilis]
MNNRNFTNFRKISVDFRVKSILFVAKSKIEFFRIKNNKNLSVNQKNLALWSQSIRRIPQMAFAQV